MWRPSSLTHLRRSSGVGVGPAATSVPLNQLWTARVDTTGTPLSSKRRMTVSFASSGSIIDRNWHGTPLFMVPAFGIEYLRCSLHIGQIFGQMNCGRSSESIGALCPRATSIRGLMVLLRLVVMLYSMMSRSSGSGKSVL